MNSEADARTAKALNRMRNEETEREFAALQQKYKRMREIKEKRKEQEEAKKKFIKNIEDTALFAS